MWVYPTLVSFLSTVLASCCSHSNANALSLVHWALIKRRVTEKVSILWLIQTSWESIGSKAVGEKNSYKSYSQEGALYWRGEEPHRYGPRITALCEISYYQKSIDLDLQTVFTAYGLRNCSGFQNRYAMLCVVDKRRVWIHIWRSPWLSP